MIQPFYENEHGKLYCGNCLEIMPALIAEGVKVDSIITDPPYIGLKGGYRRFCGGVAAETHQSVTVGDIWNASNDWLEIIPQTGASMLITFTAHNGVKDTLNQLPGKLVLIGAWHQPNAHPGIPQVPHYTIEFYIGSSLTNAANWNGISDFIIFSPDHGGCISTGERIRNEDGSNAHPTQKPLSVMRRLIPRNAQTILDPFAGSGTTLVAAQSLGRRWIGIEISPEYCEIAKKRLEGTIRQIEGQATIFEQMEGMT
jgi:DNA modification methylase